MITELPKPGEFVNLNTWFGDVWAEVMWSFESSDPRFSSVTFVCYEKYGQARYLDSTYMDRIRKVSATKPEHYSVLYTDQRYDGGFGRAQDWPRGAREVNQKTRYTPNYREQLSI